MPTPRKSLEPKVFRVAGESDKDVLLGSRCRQCRRVFFPGQEWCAACCVPSCEAIELSRQGTLKSYAVVHRKTAYSLVTPPYILAEIELPEGVLVYATLNLTSTAGADGYKFHTSVSDDALSQVSIGQPVTLKAVTVRKDESGEEIVAYNFCTGNA